MKRDALHFGSDLLCIVLVLIDHTNLGALGGHGARGRFTKTRTTTGDENGYVFQFHDRLPFLGRFFSRLVRLGRIIRPRQLPRLA
ncbi:hypothetical protein ACVW0J_002205 [Bradyrhizobium sp. i1.7.7]